MAGFGKWFGTMWNRIWVDKATDWTVALLEPGQVPKRPPNQAIQAEAEYISVTLQSMRVVNLRKAFKKFFGVAHSFTKLPSLTGDWLEVNTITTPDELKDVMRRTTVHTCAT